MTPAHKPRLHEPRLHEPLRHEPLRHESLRHESLRHKSSRLVVFVVSALALGGCVNLEGFRTEEGVPFRGEVNGIDALDCDAEPCSFVRRGFQSGTELALTFDPDFTSSVAGTITTVSDECDPVFDGTELHAIAPLVHDPLSQFDFPGGDRLRNYVLHARPRTGPLASRDVTVFLSLMNGDAVELRVVAGDGSRVCDPTDCGGRTDCDFFGIFKLGRKNR